MYWYSIKLSASIQGFYAKMEDFSFSGECPFVKKGYSFSCSLKTVSLLLSSNNSVHKKFCRVKTKGGFGLSNLPLTQFSLEQTIPVYDYVNLYLNMCHPIPFKDHDPIKGISFGQGISLRFQSPHPNVW